MTCLCTLSITRPFFDLYSFSMILFQGLQRNFGRSLLSMFRHSLEPSQNPPPPEVCVLWSGRASLFSFQPSGIINTLKELKPHEKRSIRVEVALVDISLLKCGGKSGISKWYLLRHDPSHAFPPFCAIWTGLIFSDFKKEAMGIQDTNNNSAKMEN